MARVLCDKRKCQYNDDHECIAATVYYTDRLCMTYKPIRMDEAMRPDHRPSCYKRGGKYKPSGGRVLK